MNQVIKTAGRLALLVIMLGLTACGSETPAAPTLDPAVIYTQAAVTIAAQLTSAAALAPKPTSTPIPTNTPLPTLPQMNATLPTLPGAQSTLPFATLALPTLSQATKAPAVAGSIEAQWVSSDPADGALVNTGATFDIRIRMKNIGTNVWTKDYTYRYFSGDKFFDYSSYKLSGDVKPGEEVVLVIDGRASKNPGTYYTWWKLVNKDNQNIGDFDLKIIVVRPGETPSPTKTATPASSTAATATTSSSGPDMTATCGANPLIEGC